VLFALAMTVAGRCPVLADVPPAAVTNRGVVAAAHPLAAQAGADALRRGGNAVDAAVAAAVTLGVVDGHNSGLGGGCFVLVRTAAGELLAIDGREVAPAAAHRDLFVRDGKADPALSQTGALASGVPGSLAAYDDLLRAAGKLTLADALTPAAELADRGFPIDATYARRLAEEAAALAKFPASAAALLDPAGKAWPQGHVLKQPDLARSYRAIAKSGIGWFYEGQFGQAVEEWMKQNGGILTATDFAAYRAVRREPLVTTYRGNAIVGYPPPSSGGVHVGQILNMLEPFDLAALDRQNPGTRHHVTAEAMKLAFADRAFWLGDPAFAKVPRGLTDKAYAAELAKQIRLDRATPVAAPGRPPRHDVDLFPGSAEKHTTHVAAADAAGNWVAITTTVNTAFGSKVVVPGTGIILNNQMDDFAIQPGVPNAFGLVGAEANAVAAGKRPLSSMSPTIVLAGDARTGRPVLTVGAAGGPTIISAVVQAIVNHVDLGMPVDAALAAPRIHHQWKPDALAVEKAMPSDIMEGLRALGHTVDVRDTIAVAQMVVVNAGGALTAAHDPRVQGGVAGTERGTAD